MLKVQSGGHFVRYPHSALSSCKYQRERRHASTQINVDRMVGVHVENIDFCLSRGDGKTNAMHAAVTS